MKSRPLLAAQLLVAILLWQRHPTNAFVPLSRPEANWWAVANAEGSGGRGGGGVMLKVAVDTSDIKNGMTIELEGEPYKVLSFSIMKQARGTAKTVKTQCTS